MSDVRPTHCGFVVGDAREEGRTMENGFRLTESGTVAVPAGKYFLGDPLCAFPDDARWNRLLDSCGVFQASPVGAVDGMQVVAFHTAHGDGSYECEEGEVAVDSGLIGLVPASAARETPAGMIAVEFGDTESCQAVGGTLWFGQIKFETDDSDDED